MRIRHFAARWRASWRRVRPSARAWDGSRAMRAQCARVRVVGRYARACEAHQEEHRDRALMVMMMMFAVEASTRTGMRRGV
jgi:hypothetical protein